MLSAGGREVPQKTALEALEVFLLVFGPFRNRCVLVAIDALVGLAERYRDENHGHEASRRPSQRNCHSVVAFLVVVLGGSRN